MKVKKIIIALLIFNFQFPIVNCKNIVWFDGSQPITYSVSANVSPVVKSALEIWKGDMQQVTGLLPEEAAAKRATIRIIQDKNLKKKEAFSISIKNNQIVVSGSDPRGTAYGILELSRLAGVSPWVWWGDATPDKKSKLTLPADFQTYQSPSVEFRGIFLNDEDWTLQPWAWKHFDPQEKSGLISAKTYREIFKLLLRLRANTILPAMHGVSVPFYFVPDAKEVADSFGIVIGTSHCEPLMRNNVGEWNVNERGNFNFIDNHDAVINYWTERLSEVKNFQNIYTIGMRGIHDGSMEGVKTMREKTDALQKVIYEQRDLLKKYVNPNIEKIPQQFVPYKEVLDIYENELDVPEDVMLTWCDDNYGYLTRLSDGQQQKRNGGAGVYYHLSYWGRPHDYMWLTTTQPGLIYYEMRNAYAHNARRLWVVNVHDPKIAAYDLELFLDLAWNIESKLNTPLQHLQNWLNREFGTAAGEKLFPAMHDYYRLVSIRRPEFMGWNQVELNKNKFSRGWSPVEDSEFNLSEIDKYLTDYQNIKNIISDAEKIIPENRRNVFFAAIKYPVFGSAAMATKWLEAQRARTIANGKYDNSIFERATALKTACAKSINAFQEIRELTDFYNNKLAGGKWKYAMCENPRDLYVFYTPALPIALTEKERQTYAATDLQYAPEKPNMDFIARNAFEFTKSSLTVEKIAMLGHSMNAVPLPKGETLTYEFETEREGDAVLRTAVIPTQPNDKGDIRFSVQIDSEQPQIVSFREKGRTEQWKTNVLRQQALKTTNHKLSIGKHTLKIKALDNHIVIDQWMIDFDRERKFYVLPVDSK
jgi:hypothetical protein